MRLAIFDLDDTLIKGSSDFLWEHFLIEKNFIDRKKYEDAQKLFNYQYNNGTLDIYQRQYYFLSTLCGIEFEKLKKLRDDFIETVIPNTIKPKSMALMDEHREAGDHLIIITAASRFITEPYAELFAVHDLLATEAKMDEKGFTGEVIGVPCFQSGKVVRLEEWLKKNPFTLENSIFYSDSVNDFPLLDKVTEAVAVDPDEKLLKLAKDNNWRVISLID